MSFGQHEHEPIQLSHRTLVLNGAFFDLYYMTECCHSKNEQAIMLSYTAAFNLMYVFIKRKALLIISCLLYTMLESGIAAAVASNDRFLIIAYFFPSYHFAALLGLSANTYSISTAILIPVLYIGLFTYIGYCGDQSRNRMSVSAKY